MHKVYAIYDKKAQMVIGGVHGLQVHKHEATAVRMFNDVAATDGTAINKHPEDYELVELGELDEDTGELKGRKSRNVVFNGETWKAMQDVTREDNQQQPMQMHMARPRS